MTVVECAHHLHHPDLFQPRKAPKPGGPVAQHRPTFGTGPLVNLSQRRAARASQWLRPEYFDDIYLATR